MLFCSGLAGTALSGANKPLSCCGEVAPIPSEEVPDRMLSAAAGLRALFALAPGIGEDDIAAVGAPLREESCGLLLPPGTPSADRRSRDAGGSVVAALAPGFALSLSFLKKKLILSCRCEA